MSMSTIVVGFRPADEKWNRMKQIWENCEEMGVDIPDEVFKFFDSEAPKDKPGMEVKIDSALKEWRDDSSEGFELDVTKLPSDVKFIRFYNSW